MNLLQGKAVLIAGARRSVGTAMEAAVAPGGGGALSLASVAGLR